VTVGVAVDGGGGGVSVGCTGAAIVESVLGRGPGAVAFVPAAYTTPQATSTAKSGRGEMDQRYRRRRSKRSI
jgi:hypothetical protein